MQSKVLFQTESVGLRQRLSAALRTKLGAMLLFGVLQPTTATTAYFHCLSLHLRMQKWRGQDKFLSALPRPSAGPLAVEKLTHQKRAGKTLRSEALHTTFLFFETFGIPQFLAIWEGTGLFTMKWDVG